MTLFSFGVLAQQEIVIVERKDYKKPIKTNDNIQVFKFAPLNMIAGEIAFGYERQVSMKGSVDFELGPTFSNIGIGLSSHYIDQGSAQTFTNSRMGFVFSAAYRYYPLDETEALNRFYVSPVLRYKLTSTGYSTNYPGIGNEVGNFSKLNFYFNFGYQVWASETFSIDFYTGLGIGSHRNEKFQLMADYNPDTQMYDYNWRSEVQSGAVYVFNMGLKVGIGSK